jgi:alkanesulfonate monooxygenase SsuD/methylene tetrahydromethanopterin reductase-like flavin-dependent oxidoreductase (luciferase family)
VRQERLEEAIEIIRRLWKGGNQSYRGRYFTVENARLYSPPDSPPPLYVAVGGPRSADLAGRLGDGMIGTDPDASLLDAFDRAGSAGKPRYAELTVCWAKDEATAKRITTKQCGIPRDRCAIGSRAPRVFYAGIAWGRHRARISRSDARCLPLGRTRRRTA